MKFALASIPSVLVIGFLSLAEIAVAGPLEEPSELPPINLPQTPDIEANGLGSGIETPPAEETEGLAEYAAAKRAIQQGDVRTCEQQLREMYAKRPNLPPPQMMLARLLFDLNEFRQARSVLEDAAISHRNHPQLYLLLGKLAPVDGRPTEASVLFEKAQSLDVPENWTPGQLRFLKWECLMGETTVAERRGDWDQAALLYEQQVQSRPTDSQLRSRWGAALFRIGQMKQAFEQFDVAYRQDSKLNPPEVSMAAMHVTEMNYRKADQWFEKALDLHPLEPSVHFERSIALMCEDRTAEAERHAKKAAELGLDSSVFLMHRGLIAMQLGEFDRAEEFFQHVLARDADHLGARTSLALALAEQDDVGKRKQALEVMSKISQEHSNSPMVKSVLGWVQLRNKRPDEAVASLQAAALQMPTGRDTLLFLSRALMQENRKEEAIRVAQQLERVIDEPGIFVFRPTAKRWLSQVLPIDGVK